jgi:hypothetical protein
MIKIKGGLIQASVIVPFVGRNICLWLVLRISIRCLFAVITSFLLFEFKDNQFNMGKISVTIVEATNFKLADGGCTTRFGSDYHAVADL